MKVIIKEPGKLGYEKDIPNTLEALQAQVGGFIEVMSINELMIAIFNEEGRLMNLPKNICGLQGTIIFCSTVGEDFADVNPQQAQLLLDGYTLVIITRNSKTGGCSYA